MTTTAVTGEFAHTLAVIENDASVRTHLVPEIRRSLSRDQSVLVVVSDPIAALVRADLGAAAADVEWADPASCYARLGSAFESFRRYLADRHAERRHVHVFAEPELADDGAEEACDAHPGASRACAYLPWEAMGNEAYAPYGSPVTCVWDARQLTAAVLDEARSVHDHELTATGRIPYTGYRTPDDYLAGRLQEPTSPPPAGLDHDVTLKDLDDLSTLRRTIAGWTKVHDFDEVVAADISIAVTEVATNALVHGEGPARARAWHRAGTLIVQVDDPGGRALPPAAGYRRPAVALGAGGRGLWLARQLADTVTIRTDAGRTSVRLCFPHGIMHRGLG